MIEYPTPGPERTLTAPVAWAGSARAAPALSNSAAPARLPVRRFLDIGMAFPLLPVRPAAHDGRNRPVWELLRSTQPSPQVLCSLKFLLGIIAKAAGDASARSTGGWLTGRRRLTRQKPRRPCRQTPDPPDR